MASTNYSEFLDSKAQLGGSHGFVPSFMPDSLFDFQAALVDWAVRRGRAAIFADCGLGKTLMQLVWAENVVRETNKPVLILTPLAVSHQTVREGAKFDIDCRRSADGSGVNGSRIIVANYERLEHFDSSQFAGVVCDESSILKNFGGVRRAAITEFMRRMPYRLLCSATAAPNDYTELGTSSEALGELGHMDMLSRFFKNDQNTSNPRVAWRMHGGAERMKWRFRGHAEKPFWRWVCSWARAIRRPSDIGCDDDGFILPELTVKNHVITNIAPPDGCLFNFPAIGLREQRDERRRTITERCEKVASLVADSPKSLIWCHLNREGDLLADMIPNAKQVAGSDSEAVKEERLLAFAEGNLPILITKPRIGGWGLNLQRCAHMTFFPSHSYEQYYQGVRRCWRFGQTRPVHVDLVTTEGDARVMETLQYKADQADRMFSTLVGFMNDELRIQRPEYQATETGVPEWLTPIR